MKGGDLHLHSDRSDGVVSPAVVVERVEAGGLDFFALTDHNSVAGLLPATVALAANRRASREGLLLIYGVELSAQPEDGDEIHILGYGFDPEDDGLRDACRRINRIKRDQIWEMALRLRTAGVDVDMDNLPMDDEEAYVGRPLLARMLVQSGAVHTVNRAFSQYLGREGSAFVPMACFRPRRCIEAIHGAGGLAVLAHPRIETVDRWIAPLVEMGLDGIETFRPALSGNERLYVEKAAEHFGIFLTGGSDMHGRPEEPPIGAFQVGADRLQEFFAALMALPAPGVARGPAGDGVDASESRPVE